MNATLIEQEAHIFERLLVAPEFAEAMLRIRFSPEDETRMRELMEKNNQEVISSDEQSQMEAYRQVGSFLAILQAKARLQLQKASADGNSAA